MTYSLDKHKLRVFRQLSKAQEHATLLGNTRFIVLEHILPTTEEFLRLLIDTGAEIFSLLAKPYSIDQAVLTQLHSLNIRIERKPYKVLDETVFLDELLNEAAAKSQIDGRPIIIVDVGGYFAKPLARLAKDIQQYFYGVIEDTTFGHNRYIDHAAKIPIPIFSVARSALKEIEARFVGKDAVTAVDFILRKEGVSLPGRNALVIGYGMIGKNVARALQATDLRVSVYDKRDHKNLTAFIDGFNIHTKKELIKHADIIYSATGDPLGALSFHEIEDCKDNVILVSVGSRDSEFDVQNVATQAISCEAIGSDLIRYRLHNSKEIIIARNGTAINFSLPSIPIEVLDLVFTEILSCILSLLKNRSNFPPHRIHDMSDDALSIISKGWLRFVNR